MSTSWSSSTDEGDRASNRGGSGIFVKLKDDGDTIELAIVGEPHTYWRPWLENRSRRVRRFLVNVFVPRDGMRVLETNPTTFSRLALLETEIEFARQLVRIERIGKARDPQTTYVVTPGAVISTEIAAQIAAGRPFDLRQIAESTTVKDEEGVWTSPAPPRPDSSPAPRRPSGPHDSTTQS